MWERKRMMEKGERGEGDDERVEEGKERMGEGEGMTREGGRGGGNGWGR